MSEKEIEDVYIYTLDGKKIEKILSSNLNDGIKFPKSDIPMFASIDIESGLYCDKMQLQFNIWNEKFGLDIKYVLKYLKSLQIRKHKKYRINKKLAKKYGYWLR